MSAYVLDRKHFLTVAAFVAKHTAFNDCRPNRLFAYHADNHTVDGMSDHYLKPVQVANILQQENNRSVNHRYGGSHKVRNITERDFADTPVPTPGQMNGILRSYSYQSCETDDWRTTRAHAVWVALLQLALEVCADNELGGADAPAGSTYRWA